jgi:uncharacterized protein DUF4440
MNPHSCRSGLGLFVLLAVAGATAQAQDTSPPSSPAVAAVWQLEDAYWKYVQTADIQSYVKLWHDRFRGWPCVTPHTATKDSIGNWVRRIRDEHVRLTYRLTREGAAEIGNTVIVYYSTPMLREYPDGRVEGRDTVWKFTHTWQKHGQRWLIVGGMCGLPASGVF